MSRFEDLLREALRREEPPAGFAGRVMARIGAEPEKVGRWQALRRAFEAPRLRWAGVVALCVLLVGVGLQVHHERETRAEGEAAKERLVLALQIAGSKLGIAQAKVLEMSGGRSQ